MAKYRLFVALSLSLLACCASPKKELERVAKDWCLTIRASQVIPVYPLTEDLQPGDVFLVPTSISEQASEYEKKGFLPLDQLVTRLHGLPFSEFYSDAYWEGTYAGAPHERPGAAGGSSTDPVRAPRAAFPSYTFEVNKSTGLKLALPIQGVPVGLGFMGAKKAQGSVTIRDAHTYGVDGESLVAVLRAWALEPKVRYELSRIAQQTKSPVLLRVVSRVYLAGGVTVSLANLDSSSGGLDAGDAPEIKLIDLAIEKPDEVDAATSAYHKALEAIGDPLNGAMPGGSVRFSQASRRAVTLDEDFDRPLVIGYLGFDVLVDKSGRLSAPIPSFATLSGDEAVLEYLRPVLGSVPDSNTEMIDQWLDVDGENYKLLLGFLTDAGHPNLDPSDMLEGAAFAELRRAVVRRFQIVPVER